MLDSAMLSISNWRMMRQRVAPSVDRTATSRVRYIDRDNSRLATLPHAISSTKITAPITVISIGRAAPPRNRSVNVSSFPPARPLV